MNEPLFTYDPSVPELDLILKTECGIRPGSSWLFKIASDGIAYQISSGQVRAGHKYILLAKPDHGFFSAGYFPEINIKCSGIRGLFINLPPVVSAETSDAIEFLNLHQVKTIRIWPAGYIPPKWDQEGYAECLSTEPLYIAVAADHPIATYEIEYDSIRQFMSPESPNLPLIIEISDIQPGSHLLKVSSADDNEDPYLKSGVLEIYARKPRIWTPSLTTYGAFMVIVQPAAPSLEELWDGNATVELLGPKSKSVRWEIAFFEKGKSEPLFAHIPPPLILPVYTRDWQNHFTKMKNSAKAHEKIWNAFNLSHSCKIRFDAGELGVFVLSIDRAFSPLRWGFSRKKEMIFLKLIDDSGIKNGLMINHYDFSYPDTLHNCDPRSFLSSDGGQAASGLYVAHLSKFKGAILIPPEIHALTDFSIKPRLLWRKREPAELSELVKVFSHWAGANLFGSILSLIYKAQILCSLTEKTISLIAGTRWLAIEKMILSNEREISPEEISKRLFNGKDEIKQAYRLVADRHNIASLTARKRAQYFSSLLSEHHIRLCKELSKRRQDAKDYIVWISEYLLRVASSDKDVADWAGENLLEANKWLLYFPGLILLGRLLVSLVQKAIDTEADTKQYPGWQWD